METPRRGITRREVKQTTHAKHIKLDLNKETNIKGKGVIRELILEAMGKGTTQDTNTSMTIRLAGHASSEPGSYIGREITIIDGTGRGQTRLVSDYDHISKIAVVKPGWNIIPDHSSIYSITHDGTGAYPLKSVLTTAGIRKTPLSVENCTWVVNITDNAMQVVRNSMLEHVELFDVDTKCDVDKDYDYILTVMYPKSSRDKLTMKALINNLMEASAVRVGIPIIELYVVKYLNTHFHMFIHPRIICTLSQYLSVLRNRNPESKAFKRIQRYMPTRVDPRYRRFEFDNEIQKTIYNLLWRIERGSISKLVIDDIVLCRNQNADYNQATISAYYRGYSYSSGARETTQEDYTASLCMVVMKYVHKHRLTYDEANPGWIVNCDPSRRPVVSKPPSQMPSEHPSPVSSAMEPTRDEDIEVRSPLRLSPVTMTTPTKFSTPMPSPTSSIASSPSVYLTPPPMPAAKRMVSPSSSTKKMEPSTKEQRTGQNLAYTTQYFESTPSDTLNASKSVLAELRGYEPPSPQVPPLGRAPDLSRSYVYVTPPPLERPRGVPPPSPVAARDVSTPPGYRHLRSLRSSFTDRMRAIEHDDYKEPASPESEPAEPAELAADDDTELEKPEELEEPNIEAFKALSTVVGHKHRSVMAQHGTLTGSTKEYHEHLRTIPPGSRDVDVLHDLYNAETRRFIPEHRYEFEAVNRSLGTDINTVMRHPPPSDSDDALKKKSNVSDID